MLQANEGAVKYATRNRTPTNEDNMVKYSEVFSIEYKAAASDELVIGLTFPTIPGAADNVKKIVQIERNTQPMRAVDWAYNPDSFSLTLLNGNSLSEGEILYILYKVIMIQ